MAEKKAIIEERKLVMTAQIKSIKDAIVENILNEEQIRSMALAILQNFQSVLVKNGDTMKFVALEDNIALQEITVIRIENLLDVLKNKFRGENQIDEVTKDIMLMFIYFFNSILILFFPSKSLYWKSPNSFSVI